MKKLTMGVMLLKIPICADYKMFLSIITSIFTTAKWG